MSAATAEQAALAAAKALTAKIDTLGVDVPQLKGGLDALKADFARMSETYETLKKFDVAKVLDLVEQIKAGQESIKRSIRLNSGVRVPGLEDWNERKHFSFVRAMTAIATKDWSGAPREQEMIKAAREAVQKANIIGVDSQGGNFIPEEIIADVIAPIYAESIMLAIDGTGTTRVRVLDGVTGIPAKVPKFVGGAVAYWMGEQEKFIESDVKVGNISMSPKKLGVLTRLTDEMKRFSSTGVASRFGYEQFLRQDIIRAAANLVDYSILYGKGGDNIPRGVSALSATDSPANLYSAETHSTVFNSTLAGAECGFDDLQNMQGLIEDQNIKIDSSFAYISHPKFFRRRRQDKIQYFSGQTSNFGYLLGGPMLTQAELKNIIGDYGWLAAAPYAANAGASVGKTPATSGDKKYGDVFAGNWNSVIFARWAGIEILEDQGLGRGFPTDETYMKLRMYADVGYRREIELAQCPDARMQT